MKKTISLFLVVCLTAGLFTGCIFNKTSLEEDIINMQFGGYLYTSMVRAETKDERSMLKEREKAVTSMIDYMENAAVHTFSLIKGLSKYEENLLKYIKKIDSSEPDVLKTSIEIMEKIIAYKVILDSYEDEINRYMKMKPSSSATEAIINTYKMNTICKLIETQGEYISWLINNTASVAALLENTNKRQSDNLMSSSDSIYEKQIEKQLINIYEDYDEAAYLNSVILSADYYASFNYLNETKNTIDQINSGKTKNNLSSEEISNLNNLYNEALASVKKPAVLVPIPEEKETLTFTRKVNAFDEDSYAFHTIAYLYSFSVLTQKRGLRNNPYIYDIPTSEDVVEKLEDQKKDVQENTDNIQKNITQKPAATVPDSKETSFLSRAAASGSSLLAGLIEIGTAYVDNKIEKIVKEAQENIKNNHSETNTQYAAIIEKLTEYIATGVKGSKNAETIKNLIENDLEAMLGGNKEQFINYILNSNAGDLIKTFEGWKEKISGGDKHQYTHEDLENLLAQMGISAELAEIIETSEKPTATAKPTSTVKPAVTTPVPSAAVTNQPANTQDPSAPEAGSDNYGIVHIKATWQTMREIDPTASNESILTVVYGWGDMLDYDNYEKTEIKNKDGSLKQIYYSDLNHYKVGWDISYSDTYNLFTYRFPDDNDREIVVIRHKTIDSDYIYEVQTEDKTIDRKTAVRFFYSDQPSTEESIKYILQKEKYQRDGLNTTYYNSNLTYSVFNMGNLLEQYTFKDNIIVHESIVSYEGDNVIEHTKNYYDSGKPWNEFTEVNGTKHGIFTAYDKDTGEKSTWEYNDGFIVKP